MNRSDPVLIVGTGALACLFAARLSAVGRQVQMLGTWPEGLAVLQANGVTLVVNGKRTSFPVLASADAREFAGVRWALVLVKAWQTERAAQQLFASLAVDGVALTLQNGLGHRETLVESLGAERVAIGVTSSGATLLAPGVVRAVGEGQISLGSHPRLEPLAEKLQSAGFKVEVVNDVDALAWSKLVINAAINPVTALLDIPNGEILARPTARELSAALAHEVAAVASKKRIGLTFNDPQDAVEDVVRRTAENFSSMLQDVRRGARTEIDAICGAVVQAGEEVGVSTPINDVMWKLVSALRSNA